MAEQPDGSGGIPDLDREIEGFFSGIKEREDLYAGKKALLEEQLRGVREFRDKAAGHEERERSLLSRLAAAEEGATAAAAEIKKLSAERDELNNRLSGLQFSLDSEKGAGEERENFLERAQAALKERGEEIRKMKRLLEGAEAGLAAH